MQLSQHANEEGRANQTLATYETGSNVATVNFLSTKGALCKLPVCPVIHVQKVTRRTLFTSSGCHVSPQ